MTSFVSLIERLEEGRPLLTAWCGIPEASIAGLLAREGFDLVTMDMQHGAVDLAETVRAIPLVLGAGKPVLVRVPVGEFSTASRLLDSGASGVIAPMINSAEDARTFASFAKFPPLGERSWGPQGALLLTGMEPKDYFAKANAFSLSFAMVETREALAAIDDILAVPGIDGVFVGPSDLSIALSNGASLDPLSREVGEALDHAYARTRAAGKHIGVYAASAERATELVRTGFDLVAFASDTALLRAGARASLKILRDAERDAG